jgi:hypothetical protein
MTDRLDDPFHVESLRALDMVALFRLRTLLEDNAQDERDRLMHDLMRVPHSFGVSLLGQLVALCDADPTVRLEVLRAIRDALGDKS